MSAEKTWIDRVLHFGWGTILVGAIAMAATFPGRTHGLGLVTEPLLTDLHDSLASPGDPEGRLFYSMLNFWGTLIGAAFCLPVGWLFDRYDRRWILAVNLVLLGWAVLWLSQVHSWGELFIALTLTRGFGQSALSVVSITIVARSFRAQQLGMAMAFYTILMMPMHLVLKQGVGWGMENKGATTTLFWLVDVHGLGLTWREVWGGVGFGLMLLSGTGFIISREPAIGRADATVQDKASGSTVWEALATPAFWVFSLTVSFWGMIYAGVALFNQHIFAERGFDRALYINVFSFTGIVALVSNFVFGWLVNHVRLTRLLAACLLPTACSLFFLPLATQEWHAYMYGLFLGIASGAVTLIFFAAWGRLYGRRDLARIQGAAQMLTVLASAAGPMVFSWSRNETASYAFIFRIMAALVGAMAFIAWFTPLPCFQERPAAEADDSASLPAIATGIQLKEHGIQLKEQTT